MTEMMIPLLGLVLVLAMLVAAFSGPSEAKAQKRRLTALRERHSASAASAVEAQLRRITTARATRMDSLASTLIPRPAQLKKRLDMTGRSWSVGKYALVSGGLALGGAALLWLEGAPLLLALFGGLFIGLGLPHMATGFMINRRVNQFTSKFPDAIELLVRGLRAGLPISETLSVVASEVPGPVGEEFRSVSDKMKIGRSMDVALQETSERLGTPEFQFFCITLAIQRETGGNLAETLSNLAEVLRKRAQMKLKIKAMSSESKASAYIVGSLPFIVFTMIWFLNKDYMGGFFTDERLMVAGIGGLVWMGIGAFIMAKMVNFEI
ncbi:pilus assembly protein TadB [Sphingomonas changnyeongensis]|uniref:Pilus assembly protein TadB n=1 Tax=Sphingomonas changnyeongensis TaxID=2698679 RepID=A0A7Z2NWA0_9SPHN|nr:type II secretion system F family protein [Sphingomonas changnyeongensis]QHL90409.1 pilus assembly protein TadB [Sphingomonas changnyeongensis]